jgi:flagellar hook protein FlgE
MSAIPTVANPGFGSVMNSAANGIQAAENQLGRAEQATADHLTTNSPPSAQPLVDAISARESASANARVMQAADQMLGTILDVKA